MVAEVVAIHGGAVPGKPDIGVIGALEKTLERARDGEIIGVGIVIVESNSDVSWIISSQKAHPLLAGIAFMQSEIIAERPF